MFEKSINKEKQQKKTGKKGIQFVLEVISSNDEYRYEYDFTSNINYGKIKTLSALTTLPVVCCRSQGNPLDECACV